MPAKSMKKKKKRLIFSLSYYEVTRPGRPAVWYSITIDEKYTRRGRTGRPGKVAVVRPAGVRCEGGAG